MIADQPVRLLGMRPGRRNSEEELPTRRRYIGARVVVSELRSKQPFILFREHSNESLGGCRTGLDLPAGPSIRIRTRGIDVPRPGGPSRRFCVRMAEGGARAAPTVNKELLQNPGDAGAHEP